MHTVHMHLCNTALVQNSLQKNYHIIRKVQLNKFIAAIMYLQPLLKTVHILNLRFSLSVTQTVNFLLIN